MIDKDTDRFTEYALSSLLRAARQHKGTQLGGILKCAYDQFEATNACLKDAKAMAGEYKEAITELREKEEILTIENNEMRISLASINFYSATTLTINK
jgi:hypothetical protein